MITIAAIIGVYALINISQRISDYLKPSYKEHAHALDKMQQLRFEYAHIDIATADKKAQKPLSPSQKRLASYGSGTTLISQNPKDPSSHHSNSIAATYRSGY